jgi:hypothetical protein
VPSSCTATASRWSTSPTSRGVVGLAHVPRDGRARESAGGRARRARRGARRARCDREPQLGPVAHVVLRRERVRPHRRADQLPAERRRGRVHRRPLRRVRAARRSRARARARRHRREAPIRHRGRVRRGAVPLRRRAVPLGRAQRGRDRVDQLHERYHRASEGCADHAPQRMVERGHVRLAPRDQRPRRVPAHAADVPLQRMGRPVHGHGDGRTPHRAPQGRRSRDPPSRRRARRDGHVRRTGGRGCDPRLRVGVGGTDPGVGSGPHGARGSAAAHAHDRADRVRARLGVRADLRAHGDLAAADIQPRARRVRRPLAARAGREARARGRSCARLSVADQRPRRGAGAQQRGARGGTGSSPRRRPRRSSTGGSTPATAASSTRSTTSRSRTARRT